MCFAAATSFPGLFPFELGRRPNSKGKSPGNEVVAADGRMEMDYTLAQLFQGRFCRWVLENSLNTNYAFYSSLENSQKNLLLDVMGTFCA